MHSSLTTSLLPANSIMLANILYITQGDITHETTQAALLTPKGTFMGTSIIALMNQSAAFDTKLEETISNNMYHKYTLHPQYSCCY